MNIRAYEELNRDKVTHILRRLNATYQSSMTEQVTIDSELTIEHIMPQSWWENWSLADGTPGLGYRELIDADPGDARAEATQNRERAIHTFGNLTLLTQELNSSVSNSGWAEKQPALLAASLLPLNLQLRLYEAWDEDTIASRGRELLEKALLVWPRPASRAKTS
jgi:hypothetical protein